MHITEMLMFVFPFFDSCWVIGTIQPLKVSAITLFYCFVTERFNHYARTPDQAIQIKGISNHWIEGGRLQQKDDCLVVPEVL